MVSTPISRWLMIDLLVPMQVLDRVLDGHDVRGAGRVDLVDHRRERRALAAAGRARDQHEAALLGGNLLQHLRQRQIVDRWRRCIGMTRKTMPMVPRCWKALQRKRPSPATL